jgi:hypothetical protein
MKVVRINEPIFCCYLMRSEGGKGDRMHLITLSQWVVRGPHASDSRRNTLLRAEQILPGSERGEGRVGGRGENGPNNVCTYE